jgi:molecular chaperone DnaK
MKQAAQKVQEARAMLAGIRASNLAIIRQAELDGAMTSFDNHAREHAKPTEITAFESMARTAQRLKDNSTGEFDNVLEEMRSTTWNILWRLDDFVIGIFDRFSGQPFLFPDKDIHAALVKKGHDAVERENMDQLRAVVLEMYRAKGSASWSDELHTSNII